MEKLKSALSFTVGFILVVFLSDLFQYLLLFPDKNIQVLLVFSIFSLILIVIYHYFLKVPKKYYVINIVLVLLLMFSGFYERIFSANELSVSFNATKLILSELKPKLNEYVTLNNKCPNSFTELIDNNNALADSIGHNYLLKSLNDSCYIIATHIGDGVTKNIEFPNENKLIYLKSSIYWTFILNDLIYSLSSYDKNTSSFGLKVPVGKGIRGIDDT